MKLKICALTTLILACGLSQAAMADGANINFTGSLLSTSCSVKVNGNDTAAVDLGDNMLEQGQGKRTDPKSFSLDISDCPASSQAATVTLSGTTATDTDFFAVNVGGKAQDEVGLLVLDSNGSLVKPNGGFTTTLSDGGAKLTLNAQLINSQDSVVPQGAIAANVAVNVAYQ